jgi:non-ribosomal peptide synthetase component F
LLREESLAEILAATARRLPQQPALILGERVVSYGELDLASDGIGGAAWLPFDADTPLARIEIVCNPPKPPVRHLPRMAAAPTKFPVSVWAVEDLEKEARGFGREGRGQETPSPPPIASRPKSSDPAYVIYTSGFTGQPKGIVISQRGICHFSRAENVWIELMREIFTHRA